MTVAEDDRRARSSENGCVDNDGTVAGEPAFSRTVGHRLRTVRRAQGLSLAEVEEQSGGRWSASALGAYERGFRNLSLPRLKALADFFSVPAGVLLGEPTGVDAPENGAPLVFDLVRLRAVMADTPLLRFTETIAEARGDYNGQILSIRRDDLQAVCAMVDSDPSTALKILQDAEVLLTEPVDPERLSHGGHGPQ